MGTRAHNYCELDWEPSEDESNTMAGRLLNPSTYGNVLYVHTRNSARLFVAAESEVLV